MELFAHNIAALAKGSIIDLTSADIFRSSYAQAQSCQPVSKTPVWIRGYVAFVRHVTRYSWKSKQVRTRPARSLDNLCGVIDPARINFSGLNMRSSHYWLEPAKTALFANVRASMQGRLEFVANDRDDVFWSHGAAALVLHQLYRSPLLLRAKKAATR